PTTTSFADTGLSAAPTYSYTVAARDAAGNTSANSASESVTIADTTPPTTPTGLTAAVAGSTGANLSLTASTDNVPVTGYRVRRASRPAPLQRMPQLRASRSLTRRPPLRPPASRLL